MAAIIYKEFYNKDRGLPEPIWGEKTKDYKDTALQCPVCGSTDMHYSAHPDDPEEVFTDTVRCKSCGHITDWYEAYKQGHGGRKGQQIDRLKIKGGDVK